MDRLLKIGSPCATLFITVLFLQQLTENLSYLRVIKDQTVPDEAEAALIMTSACMPTRFPNSNSRQRIRFPGNNQISQTTSQARYSLRTIRTITPPVPDTEYR